MPRITTYCVPLETVKKASFAIEERVASAISISAEHVTIAVNTDQFVKQGKVISGYPFVEICLFDRGQEREDAVAQIVTEELKKAGCADVDVYLTKLEKRRYFENGTHF